MNMWLFPLWVIIDVLVGLAAISMWIAAPEYRSLNWGLTIFSLSMGLTLAFLKWSQLKVYLRSSYFKHVVYHSLNVFLIIAILGVLNYLGNKNYKEFDLTIEKRNSLTDQSKKVLEMVKEPLTLTLFAKREEWKRMLDMLKLYQAQNKKIKLDAIDTDVRPDLVKAKNISENGTVLINYKGKESRFMIGDELAVTNALLKSLREEQIVLYMVTGHEELSCATNTEEGISELCHKLEAQNYLIKNLDLTKTKSVPNDATGVDRKSVV